MKTNNITLGILNADELTPEIEAKFGNYSDMFQNLFINNKCQFSFNPYQVTQKIYPQDINDCDAYLITGSKSSAYENTHWIIKLKEFIRKLQKKNKKIIGICFGHQIIAEALGGKVEKNLKGWGVGLVNSKVDVYQSWMVPETTSYSLLASHQDQVIILPKDAIRIAGNSFCHNGSFQIGKNILTFQGHPEFTKEYLLHILKNRRKIIGEKTYQNALTSLEQKPDAPVIVNWISNFLH